LRLPLATTLALLTLTTAGCAAHMKVAPALEDGADAWEVSGANPRIWGAPIAFGPWRAAAAVSDGTTLGWSADVLGLGKVAGGRRPYALRLEGPAGAMEVECLQQRLEAVAPFGVAVDLEQVGGKPALACAFRPRGATTWAGAWTLLLRATGVPTAAFRGELRDARGVSFSVTSVHLPSGGGLPLGTPAGWSIEREGLPVAAVETLDAGRVLIARRESEAAALSAAAAALLLFQTAD
jgi:hypothetical protein